MAVNPEHQNKNREAQKMQLGPVPIRMKFTVDQDQYERTVRRKTAFFTTSTIRAEIAYRKL